ncbi:MAG: PAS-domain containing protein [Aliihoeflea sp.]|uniref:PAS-domain containing protein n=1 Tax=Aliihoeflea sp. TaxID=2608088 RepID=UPI004034EF8B
MGTLGRGEAKAGRFDARRRARGFGVRAAAAALAATTAIVPGTAFAQTGLRVNDVAQFSLLAGVVSAAFISAFLLIRERGRIDRENQQLKARLADLGTALRRSDALLNLRDQRVVVWDDRNSRPELVGTLPPDAGAPEDRATFLAFGRWLAPQSASALERALGQLRDKGTNFELVIETISGSVMEAQGRSSLSHCVVRFSALSRRQRELAELQLDHQRVLRDHETILALIDALPAPFWLRDGRGKLEWVNKAYARLVDGGTVEAVLRDERELLSENARDAMARNRAARPIFEQTLSVVVGGERQMYAVTDFAAPDASAGLALDKTEVETIREEYQRTIISHADTLDQLQTAVAIFDADQKLLFFNQAFQKLWALDPAFLESAPDQTLLLDRLRSDGKLAEQPEWRRWKETILAAYRAIDPQEHVWHLPDGRTLRVVGNPQPKGGVTWVFENLTEQLNLESRYHTAVRVQGETLDNLAEGVAVFGPDGKIRLANPAFSHLWNLAEGLVKTGTHIAVIRAACEGNAIESPWSDLVSVVTGFDEERRDRHGQAEMRDGTVLRYAVIHLPNGQVMTTFVDVTDSVNVERALKDRNEALERADRLKNDFVQHVSYELRSPLTNIIGFTELLSLGGTGPLNERQREYVGHIGSSSAVLLTIVNDILDLATVDAGIMQLDIGEIVIDEAVQSASDLVVERLREHNIKLAVDLSQAPATLHADGHRLRQILYNLLNNAANYAPEGSTVRLDVRALPGDLVEFRVGDDGPGMSEEVLETIFQRFESHANGGRKRGAGLGLSIVKSFVELHSGTVEIRTGRDQGTTVICRLPAIATQSRAAAE